MRRKVFLWVLAGILIFGIVLMGTEIQRVQEAQKGIAGEVIRFHVLANSDQKNDQQLKEKVRDEVVALLQKELKAVKTKEEAREIIGKNLYRIREISKKCLEKEGVVQPVSARITTCDFPVKAYGDTIFPSGVYETLQVEIGQAKGHNWWCVMYPALCMVEEGIAVVPPESKEKLKQCLTEEEYEMIQFQHKRVQYKLKIVEFWEHLWD